jgi:hypothetical protein
LAIGRQMFEKQVNRLDLVRRAGGGGDLVGGLRR